MWKMDITIIKKGHLPSVNQQTTNTMKHHICVFLLFSILPLFAADYEAEIFGKAVDFPGGSGGKAIVMTGSRRNMALGPAADVVIPFTVPSNGFYSLSLVAEGKTPGSNSVYFAVDNLRYDEKHLEPPQSLTEVPLLELRLDAGAHSLSLWTREEGFTIDLLRVVQIPRRQIAFSVPAEKAVMKDNVRCFSVDAPAPGVYVMTVDSSVASPVNKTFNGQITIGGNRPITRRILRPMRHSDRQEIGRLIFPDNCHLDISLELPETLMLKSLLFKPFKAPAVPKAAQDYQPRVTPPSNIHPRLFVTPELQPRIKTNLLLGENQKKWDAVRIIALQKTSFTPPNEGEVMYNSTLATSIECKAFYYLMTGDVNAGKEAVDLTMTYFMVVSFGNGQDICRKVGEHILIASEVYDWCYPLMTDEQRAILRKRFIYLAEEMECSWPPFKQTITTGHGNEAQISRDLFAMSIAVFDEDPIPYKYCAWAVFEVLEPMKNITYKSYRHDQGSAYGNYRFTYDLFAKAIAKTSLGIDLFTGDMAQLPYYWLYLRLPDGRLQSEGDDYQRTGLYRGNPYMNLLASSLFKEPYFEGELAKFQYKTPLVPFLIFHDPTVAPKLDRTELPLTRIFNTPLPGLIARTGWNEGLTAEDVIVTMNGANIHHDNHQHKDAGAVQIYYRGNLLSDIGQYGPYGSEYDFQFNKSSLAHSVPRLIDPKQRPLSMDKYNNGSQLFPNYTSGGPVTAEDYRNPKFHIGDTLYAYAGPVQDKPLFSVIKTDLTRSYTGRAKKVLRTTMFINQQEQKRPGLVILRDRIQGADPRIDVVAQLTTECPVTQNGTRLTFSQNSTGRLARLDVQTLLPKAPRLTIHTGKDAHTFGKHVMTPPFPDASEASGSRIEFRDEPGKINCDFIHVMQILDDKLLPYDVTLTGDRQVEFPGFVVAFDQGDVTIAADNTRVILPDIPDGDYTIVKDGVNWQNATVRNGFFRILPKGVFRLIPAVPGLPSCPVPPTDIKPLPPPEQHLIWLDSLRLPTLAADGRIDLTAFLNALNLSYTEKEGSLTFAVNGKSIVVTAGSPVITWDGVSIKLSSPVRKESGSWLAEPAIISGLLGLSVVRDNPTDSYFFHGLPVLPRVLFGFSSDGNNQGFQDLLTTGTFFQIEGRDVSTMAVLREPMTLKSIEASFNHGEKRKMTFSVEVSLDGKEYTRVLDAVSSGKTSAYETFVCKPTAARFIRFKLHGNSVNAWNAFKGLRLKED